MNAEGPSLFANLMPIVLIFGIFYFLIIRPQQKQEKERQKMLANLAKGDKIVTTGGLIGTIVEVRTHEVDLKIAENVKVSVVKSSVMSLVTDQPAQAPVKPS